MTQATSPWMGIDFGTCRSSAAVLLGNEPRLVSLGYGVGASASDTPTAVFIEQDGAITVGDQAVNARVRDVSRYFDRFKLNIGSDRGISVSVDGARRTYAWADLVAAVLAAIRRSAEAQFNNGEPLTRVVLTVPAVYVEGGPQWQVMEESARKAGFESIHIVREPYAAAIYYDHVLRQNGSDAEGVGKITLVYDLGGGTFDPALIRRTAHSYEIAGAAAMGEAIRCGGIFFDERIRDDFRTKCPDACAHFRPLTRNGDGTIAPEHAVTARRQAKDLIEMERFLTNVKHRFADPEVGEVREPEPITFEHEYRLTRQELYSMIEPMIEATLDCCEALVRRSGIEWRQIHRIVLVGGSCHIPFVREKLAARARGLGATDVEICWRRVGQTDRVFDPLLAVSLGAALSLDGNAMKETGDSYAHGRGVTRNEVEAVAWYRKGADQGDAGAQYALAGCFFAGRGVPADPQEGARWCRRAADQGLAEAQYDLADCYENGRGVVADLHKAGDWYRKAAELGLAQAQLKLGHCYAEGKGCIESDERANEWYRRAADQENAEAQYQLGARHHQGLGTASDGATAVQWLGRAANRGHIEAQAALGAILVAGLDVPAEPAQGLFWLGKAASTGHAEAQCVLGACYQNGLGVAADASAAAQWYRKSAEQGDTDAQTNLGWCYFNGTGVVQDFAPAAQWFEKAALQGNADAQNALGFLLEDGRGVPADMTRAIHFYRLAAEQGHAVAQSNYGMCFKDGKGVPRNPKTAADWFLAAAKQNEPAAMNQLGLCWLEVDGLVHDDKQAAQWFRQAADAGLPVAFRNLGYMLASNRAVIDSELMTWLQQHAKNGQTSAARVLAEIAVLQCARTGLASVPSTFFIPAVPQEKFANAREIYSSFLGEGDLILALYDDTIWGGAKEGFVITSCGIGWKLIGETPLFRPFESVDVDSVVMAMTLNPNSRPLARSQLRTIAQLASAEYRR